VTRSQESGRRISLFYFWRRLPELAQLRFYSRVAGSRACLMWAKNVVTREAE